MVFLSLSHGFSQDVAPQTSTSEGPKTSGERRLQHAKSTLDAANDATEPVEPIMGIEATRKKGISLIPPDKMVSYPFKMDQTWSFYPFKMDQNGSKWSFTHSKCIKKVIYPFKMHQKGHLTIQHGRKVGALGGLNKPKCLCRTLFGTPKKSLVYHHVS